MQDEVMSSNHISTRSHRSGYIRCFWIFLPVYAIACTLMCIYFIANYSMVITDYSTANKTLKEVDRRVRDLSTINQQIKGVKVACRPVPREELRKKLGPAFIPRYMSEDEPEINDANAIIEESKIGSVQSDQKIKKLKQLALPFFVNSEFSRILFDEHAEPPEVDNLLPISENKDTSAMVNEKLGSKEEVNMHEGTFNTNKIHGHRHNHQYEKKLNELDAVFEHKKRVESKLLDTDFEQGEPTEPDVGSGFKSEEVPETFIKTVVPDRKRPKRSVAGGMPWLCESEIVWLDLGIDYFPRFLRSVVCKQTQCWWRNFHCRPKAFTVKVLRRIKDTCIVDNENLMSEKSPKLYENGAVPRELREQWMFEERAITFCCECAS